jgi:hypothetical protein
MGFFFVGFGLFDFFGAVGLGGGVFVVTVERPGVRGGGGNRSERAESDCDSKSEK